MKLAIATPVQVGPGWTPFLTEFLTPAEIRTRLSALYEREHQLQDAGTYGPDTEVRIVSMNRTVLDVVSSENAKEVEHMTYEDVLVWKEGWGLVPLLDLRQHDWLCHFLLGDLFERERL